MKRALEEAVEEEAARGAAAAKRVDGGHAGVNHPVGVSPSKSNGSVTGAHQTLFDAALHPTCAGLVTDNPAVLRVALDTMRCELERARARLAERDIDAERLAKLARAVGRLTAERDEAKSALASLESAGRDRQRAERERDDAIRALQEASAKRLDAEREAAQYRVECARLRSQLEATRLCLSPVAAAGGGDVPHDDDDDGDAPPGSLPPHDALDVLQQSPAKAAHSHNKNNSTPPSRVPSACAHAPVVCLTGFSDARVAELIRLVEQLGGSVRVSEQFDDSVTHVIRPADNAGVRMKTLAAYLVHAWVVSEEWLLASAEQRRWVDEGPYGDKTASDVNPLHGKTFLIHRDVDETKRRNARLLIELGGGAVRDGAGSAGAVWDHRIVTREHQKTRANDLFWTDFLQLIKPMMALAAE